MVVVTITHWVEPRKLMQRYAVWWAWTLITHSSNLQVVQSFCFRVFCWLLNTWWFRWLLNVFLICLLPSLLTNESCKRAPFLCYLETHEQERKVYGWQCMNDFVAVHGVSYKIWGFQSAHSVEVTKQISMNDIEEYVLSWQGLFGSLLGKTINRSLPNVSGLDENQDLLW